MFVLPGSFSDVFHLTFSPDSKGLLSTPYPSGCVWLWDLLKREPRQAPVLGASRRSGPPVLAPGAGILASAVRGTVALRDLRTGEERRFPLCRPTLNEQHCLLFSADGTSLFAALMEASAVGTRLGVVRLDLASETSFPLRQHKIERWPTRLSLANTPELTLAVGEWERVRLLTIPTGEQTEIPLPRHNQCKRLIFAPDGEFLVILGERILRLWDVAAKQMRTTWKEPRMITNAAFTPDGRILATSHTDGTVRFWDVFAWRELTAFDWRIGPLYSVAVAPDGMKAAAGGRGKIVVWDLDLP
jgi:WD40 repeat protein